MSTLGQKAASHLVQATVYAMPKVGKTFGAGTFPRPNFIDLDAGIGTLATPEFIKKHGWHPDIMYEDFKERKRDKRGVIVDHNAYDDACRYFDKCMQPHLRDSFDTWVIDSGTALVESAMNKTMVLLGGKGFSGISSKTHKEALEFGLVVPKIQDYGSERSLTEQFVQMVKDTGKHILFICHERVNTDNDGLITSVTPLLTGKSVQVINAMFDDVWRVEGKKVVVDGKPVTKRILRTETDGIIMAGSRLGLPNGTEWNWESISTALDANRAARAALTTTTKE